MWLLLLGCSELVKGDPITPGLYVSFDAVIQRNGWGDGMGRCEVQLAFLQEHQSDGMWEGPGQLWDPLALPEEDQSCAATLRDPDEMEAALAAQDPPEDNWELESRLEVGGSVRLEGKNRDIELLPTYDDEGEFVNYSMPDCGLETFPFSESFDLVVDEGSDQVPPFRIDDALGIGPRMDLVGLGSTTERASNVLYQDEDYPLAWEFQGDIGKIDVELEHLTWLTVRNSEVDGIQEFEALVCKLDPADGAMSTQFHVPAADLALLTPNPSLGGPYVVGIQLDSRTSGPELEMPWGQRIRIQSTVSIDGRGELLAGRE